MPYLKLLSPVLRRLDFRCFNGQYLIQPDAIETNLHFSDSRIDLPVKKQVPFFCKTRNTEHHGTFRNIQEHEKIKVIFYEKITEIK